MTITEPKLPATSFKAFFKRLPFYIGVLSFTAYAAWLLPNYYRDPTPDRLVAGDMPPEKIAETLKALTADERAALIAREKQHLSKEPLDKAALVNLAMLQALEGKPDKSKAISLRAANRSLRDVAGQVAAIGISLDTKNYKDVVYRIDAVLRANPDFAKSLYPMMMSLTQDKAATDALVDVLGQEPPWRAEFMGFASKQVEQANLFYNLLTSLRDKNLAVTDTELRSYLTWLTDKKQFETAYYVWLDFLSPVELPKVGLVYDGGFELNPRNLFFDWNIVPPANAQISIVSRTGKVNNRALMLQFANLKGPFFGAYQYLRLDPGHYQFSTEYMTSKFKTPDGLVWRATCAETGAVIAMGRKITANSPWDDYTMDVSVPPENCATQVLGLAFASNAVLDQVVDGNMSFDEVHLTKVD